MPDVEPWFSCAKPPGLRLASAHHSEQREESLFVIPTLRLRPACMGKPACASSSHGGLIYLDLKVAIGQAVILQNPETDEEQPCRIAYLNELPEGKTEVGIEFVRPAPHFWGVAFPLSDWALRPPEITSDTF